MSDRAMNKDTIVRVLGIAVALFVVFQAYQLAAQRKAAEIARITTQRDSLVAANVMLEKDVAFRDSLRTSLEVQVQVQVYRAEADTLRTRVGTLEATRVETRIELLSLRDAEDVAAEFREAFPLLESEMKVLNAPPPGQSFAIDWLTVPLNDAQAFIGYKNDADSYQAQVGLLQRMDTLQLNAAFLGDSITALVAANAEEYKQGYEQARDYYLDLVPRYVNELHRPSIEFPNLWGIIGGAALGGVLGYAIP
jgi:hypothetical protein